MSPASSGLGATLPEVGTLGIAGLSPFHLCLCLYLGRHGEGYSTGKSGSPGMLSEMPTAVAAVLLLRKVGGSEGKDLYHRPCPCRRCPCLLVLGPPARRTVVSVSRIDLSPEELDLLAGLHRRSSLDLSKEASIRLLRYLHLSGLLEEITTRLDDVLAKELEQHSAQVFR